jgi:hypothetical protein
VSRTRLVEDLQAFVLVAVGSVLLGAPAGLLWSAIAPRLDVHVSARGIDAGEVESSEAFIGADGSYFLLMLAVGVLCGLLGFRLFRQAGPAAVLGLAVGGAMAALVAMAVGLLPGAESAIDAVTEGSGFRGDIELYLGRLKDNELVMRSTWAFLAWPAGACLGFLARAAWRPELLTAQGEER